MNRIPRAAVYVGWLLVTISWWLAGSALFFGNEYRFFALRGLLESALLLPIFFLIIGALTKYFLSSAFQKILETTRTQSTTVDFVRQPRIYSMVEQILRRNRFWLATSLSALSVVMLFPLSIPAFPAGHSLEITAIDGTVEIRQLLYLDGSPIPLEEFELSGDWQVVGDMLIAQGGEPGSTARLAGMMPGGVVLSVRHNVEAGRMLVLWDGEQTEWDLSASQSVTNDVVFGGSGATPGLLLLVRGFYFLAFWSLTFVFALLVEMRWPRPVVVNALLAVLNIAIMASFVPQKLAYAEFSAERVFRDTEWYVETASAPLGSLDFWAGTRAFTYPLVFKLFGINSGNFTDPDLLADVVQFQYWFSIFAWSALALAVSQCMRALWLRPVVLSLVLYFSLNLQISIWDNLILSESTSFSLFALLIAVWILWNATASKETGHLAQIGYLSLTVLITILYVFSRESNQYFVFFGVLILLSAGLFGILPPRNTNYLLAYFVIFIGIVVGKNISFERSNLWQVHLFDHLAHRIIPDERMLDFFVSAGLPLSEDLIGITDMPGHEYLPYLFDDPGMAEVREWVSQYGLSTYLGYLISHPIDSLIEPLRQFPSILLGDNLEYHNPRYAVQTIPVWLMDLTRRFYPRDFYTMIAFVGLAAFGVIRYIFDRNQARSSWIVVAVLLVSLYPMMFIIWHGNPIEIERHAASIGIQLRLMGWMTVALLLDQLASGKWYTDYTDYMD